MNGIMKKTLLTLVAVVFTLSLVACGDKPDSGGSGGREESVAVDDSWDGNGELATKLTNPQLDVAVSGEAIAGLSGNLLTYNDENGNVWFSGVSSAASGTAFVVLDLGRTENVHKVALRPYLATSTENGTETVSDEVQCFPGTIRISYCIQYGRWSVFNEYTEYRVTSKAVTDGGLKHAEDEEFGFGTYITARYVRFDFTDLGDDGLSNYLVKLCAVKAYISEASELDEAYRIYAESEIPMPYTDFTVTASSVNDADPLAPFTIASLSDGNYGSLWCSEWVNELSRETDEYIDIISAGGKAVKFTRIALIGAPDNQGFPTGFEIRYQIDGSGFVTHSEYKDYVNPRGEKDIMNVFELETPIVADTVRIQFNEKGLSGSYYIILMGEVEATATEATDAEIEAAKAAYFNALGQEETKETKDDSGLFAGLFAGSAAVAVLGGALLAASFIVKKKENKNA